MNTALKYRLLTGGDTPVVERPKGQLTQFDLNTDFATGDILPKLRGDADAVAAAVEMFNDRIAPGLQSLQRISDLSVLPAVRDINFKFDPKLST